MATNPIKYDDLFDSGVASGINNLKTAIQETDKALTQMMDNAKSRAGVLSQALSAANPGTQGGQQEIARLMKEIEELREKYERLAETKKRMKNLTEEEIMYREITKQGMRDYTNQVKADIATMKLREDRMKRLSDVAELQKMSYNELSQAYRDLVSLANSMTAATKEEMQARTQTMEIAKNVRMEMIKQKEAMGNHTLSVGNYAKAFNGLDLAMQQIVRETPTITMGARMYFMAISNNLPILTDTITRIRKENAERQKQIDILKTQTGTEKMVADLQKQQIPIGKQIITSLLSWQTIMIAAITVLTMYGDKIVDWIADVFSAEGATKAWKEAQEDLNKTFDESEVSAAKATAQADTLYKIATDETRSVEDRIKAGRILQNQYEDYFGNLSTEEIMLGKAVKAHDDLTVSLMNQAKARAYLDKITELYGKRIEAQAKVDEAQKTLNEKQDASREFQNQVLFRYEGEELNNAGYNMGARVNAEIDRAKAHVGETVQGVKAIDDEIKKLRDEIPVDGLFDELFNGGGRKGKGPKVVDPFDAVISNLKYIRQAREAEINNIEDDTERELALTEFKYDNEIADLRAFAAQQQAIAYTVAEMEQELERETNLEKRNAMQERINDLKREWNITEEGVQAVNDTIIQKETEKENKLRDIREKHINQMKTDYQNILKMELDIANKRAENDLEGEALDEAKIQNQIHYWEQILVLLQGFNDGSIEAARNIELVEETIRGLYLTLDKKAGKESWFEKFFGEDSPLVRRLLKDLEKALKETAGNIKDIISLYEDMAHAAVEAAEAQVSAAERVYDAELTAYENGYANNVEYARKELELRRNTLEEAEARERRYAEMKEQVDAAMNMASMIRTSYNLAESASNLMASGSKWGIVGVGIAAAAIAAMFATFAAARIQARKLSSMQYGEGGTEYIGYGGTHASGNDVDFGTMPDGRPRRIERGETVAVINAKQTSKYGYSTVSDIIDSINKGEFVERYMTAFSGADGEFTMNMSSSFDSPYLSDISRDLKAIRKGGEYNESVMADGSRIVRYKNYTRRIRP